MKTPIKWKDLNHSVPPLNKWIWVWDGKEAWTAKFSKNSQGMTYRFNFRVTSGEKPPKSFSHWCEIPLKNR